MRILFTVVRVAIVVAIVAAVIGQLQVSIAYWERNGLADLVTPVVSFFSFFTVLSNIATVIVMGWGAVRLAAGRLPDSQRFLHARAAVFAYMAVTGVVYNLLLRGIPLPQGTTLDWSNEVFHVVGPAVVVLDWFLAPGRRPIEWRALWSMLVFPLVWVVYTMIRGPLTPDEIRGTTSWYPYPFLNPDTSPNGWASVAFYIVLIALVIASLAALAILVSRRWPVPPADPSAPRKAVDA